MIWSVHWLRGEGGYTGVTIDDVKLFLLFMLMMLLFSQRILKSYKMVLIYFMIIATDGNLCSKLRNPRLYVLKRGDEVVMRNRNMVRKTLNVVTSLSYLGIGVSPTGSFHQAQITLAAEASNSAFSLSRNLNNFPGIKPKHSMELFDKLISPISNYGSEVWGLHDAPVIEKVHLKFWKTYWA